MGPLGMVVSIGSKAILLALAFLLLVYQNIYELYRYFPSVDETECTSSGGIMVRESNGKPFSGLMRSCTENSMSLYSYKDGELDGLDVVYSDGMLEYQLMMNQLIVNQLIYIQLMVTHYQLIRNQLTENQLMRYQLKGNQLIIHQLITNQLKTHQLIFDQLADIGDQLI